MTAISTNRSVDTTYSKHDPFSFTHLVTLRCGKGNGGVSMLIFEIQLTPDNSNLSKLEPRANSNQNQSCFKCMTIKRKNAVKCSPKQSCNLSSV